jgi:hypothetical protein
LSLFQPDHCRMAEEAPPVKLEFQSKNTIRSLQNVFCGCTFSMMLLESDPEIVFSQDFGSSGGGAIDGRIGKGPSQVPFNPPPSDNIFSDKQSLLGSQQAAAASRSWNPFSLALFQSYFDVDTSDIVISNLRCI